MSVLCPSGHRSQTVDYCDQCGAPIGRTSSDPVAPIGRAGPAGLDPGATAVLPVLDELDTSASARREPCPACGAQRSGDDRYCEGCGYDFLSPPAAVVWEAAVAADRAQFDRNAMPGMAFPVDCGERRFRLVEGENRIGRRRGTSDEDVPEIDLAGSPADPGISRLHAALQVRGDGTVALRDLGSTNGTSVNDEAAPVAPHTDVPLSDGDEVHLGVWTTIAVRRR